MFFPGQKKALSQRLYFPSFIFRSDVTPGCPESDEQGLVDDELGISLPGVILFAAFIWTVNLPFCQKPVVRKKIQAN